MIEWLKKIDYDYSMEFAVFSAAFILIFWAILNQIQKYRRRKVLKNLWNAIYPVPERKSKKWIHKKVSRMFSRKRST